MKTMSEQRMVMESKPKSSGMLAAMVAGLLALAGCTTTPNRAPVEDRNAAPRSAPAPNGAASAVALADSAKPLPGAENAGKQGYYMVKPGDTLIRIGLDNG